MKRPGWMVSKCRRCGGIERNPHTPCISASTIAVVTDTRDPAGSFGAPTMIGMHSCADGGLGITDLIGAEPDPT